MAKNTAPAADNMTLSAEDKELAGFIEQQVGGFPPYWNPKIGDKFFATVVGKDDSDPEFERYVLQAKRPLKCARGKRGEQDEVIVNPGEYFTCSVYAALPLARYIGFDVFVTVKGQRDVGRPQPMWVFTLAVSPETHKALMAKEQTRALGPKAGAKPASDADDSFLS